jgi:hypothetical protein
VYPWGGEQRTGVLVRVVARPTHGTDGGGTALSGAQTRVRELPRATGP